ncbi:Zinc finger protein 195 [Plecturocebus cupreus]
MPVIPATGRLRQENRLNPGGGGCSESRLRHCTPAWATRKGFHHIAQAGFQLLGSSDLPAWASQSARVIGVNHRLQPALKKKKESSCLFVHLLPWKYSTLGQARWLTPVIPALWEAESVRSRESNLTHRKSPKPLEMLVNLDSVLL